MSNNQPIKTPGSWRRTLSLEAEKRGFAYPLEPSESMRSVFLLLDISGSMSGEKLSKARDGANRFANDAVAKGWSVGVIAFGSEASLCCKPTKNLKEVAAAMPTDSDGSTAMDKALLLAKDTMRRARDTAICVVSDGEPNDEPATLQIANAMKRENVKIITLAIEPANLEFLGRLASSLELSKSTASEAIALSIGKLALLLPGPKS